MAGTNNSKKSGNGFGFFLGALATLATGVVIKKTCDKNIVDGTTNVYDKSVSFVKAKVQEHKEKKSESDTAIKSED